MTRALLNRAKLFAMAAGLAAVAIACSSGGNSNAAAVPTSTSGAAAVTSSTPVPTLPAGTSIDQIASADAQPGLVSVQDVTGVLFLELESPAAAEMFVTAQTLEIFGRTTVDALLSVNDTVLEVNEEGRFAFAVGLEEGPNLIEVVASNSAGEQADQVLLVIYEPA